MENRKWKLEIWPEPEILSRAEKLVYEMVVFPISSFEFQS